MTAFVVIDRSRIRPSEGCEREVQIRAARDKASASSPTFQGSEQGLAVAQTERGRNGRPPTVLSAPAPMIVGL